MAFRGDVLNFGGVYFSIKAYMIRPTGQPHDVNLTMTCVPRDVHHIAFDEVFRGGGKISYQPRLWKSIPHRENGGTLGVVRNQPIYTPYIVGS